jgi:hypothetical protein
MSPPAPCAIRYRPFLAEKTAPAQCGHPAAALRLSRLGEVRILAVPLQPRNRLEHHYDDYEDPVYAIWRRPRRRRPAGANNRRHGLHRSATGDASGDDDCGKPLRGRRAHPGHRLAARCPPGSGAARGGHAVHRRLRRDRQAPRDSRGRDVQPHALFHRRVPWARSA